MDDLMKNILNNLDWILGKMDEITTLSEEYKTSPQIKHELYKNKLKNTFNELKDFLKKEYNTLNTSKYSLRRNKLIDAFYYPAIRDAYIEISGFGSNLITKNNLGKLELLIYSASSDVRYWKRGIK